MPWALMKLKKYVQNMEETILSFQSIRRSKTVCRSEYSQSHPEIIVKLHQIHLCIYILKICSSQFIVEKNPHYVSITKKITILFKSSCSGNI